MPVPQFKTVYFCRQALVYRHVTLRRRLTKSKDSQSETVYPMRLRDDFPKPIKDTLAKRVGYQCSNPNCRQLTSGPQDNPRKSVNVGVAAHISAASPGGPRYDVVLSPDVRMGIDNGIWLCQKCAKLIDNDETHYTSVLLRQWKKLSEEATRLAIESGTSGATLKTDIELLRFYAQCFDRPAFQDPFQQEGSMEAFDRAIEDTITALNTGCLRARDGGVLQRSRGKKYISNSDWRDALDTIVDMLRAIRSRYNLAVHSGELHLGTETNGNVFYVIRDQQLSTWMDNSRLEILEIFSSICDEAGLPQLSLLRNRRHKTFPNSIGAPIRAIFVPPPEGIPPKKS